VIAVGEGRAGTERYPDRPPESTSDSDRDQRRNEKLIPLTSPSQFATTTDPVASWMAVASALPVRVAVPEQRVGGCEDGAVKSTVTVRADPGAVAARAPENVPAKDPTAVNEPASARSRWVNSTLVRVSPSAIPSMRMVMPPRHWPLRASWAGGVGAEGESLQAAVRTTAQSQTRNVTTRP
jgi:hypothetical protein